MKVEFLNPFIEAAYYVLKEVIPDIQIQRGKLELRSDPMLSSGVASIIGIMGQLKGHVIYDMEKKTAVSVASLMNGEDLPGLDNLVRSTINELANMISGNASSKLSQAGYNCNITPPTFIVGTETEVYATEGQKHLVVPIELFTGEEPEQKKIGKIVISISLDESAK